MHEKNVQLTESLKKENSLKVDLFSSLKEAMDKASKNQRNIFCIYFVENFRSNLH